MQTLQHSEWADIHTTFRRSWYTHDNMQTELIYTRQHSDWANIHTTTFKLHNWVNVHIATPRRHEANVRITTPRLHTWVSWYVRITTQTTRKVNYTLLHCTHACTRTHAPPHPPPTHTQVQNRKKNRDEEEKLGIVAQTQIEELWLATV